MPSLSSVQSKKKIETLIKSGDFKKALNECELEIMMGKTDPTIYAFKGFCLSKLDNIDGSVNAYSRALDLDPSQEIAQKGLIDYYSKTGDTNHCIELYETIISDLKSKKSPKIVKLYLKIAKLYEQVENYEKSVSYWNLLYISKEIDNDKRLDVLNYIMNDETKCNVNMGRMNKVFEQLFLLVDTLSSEQKESIFSTTAIRLPALESYFNMWLILVNIYIPQINTINKISSILPSLHNIITRLLVFPSLQIQLYLLQFRLAIYDDYENYIQKEDLYQQLQSRGYTGVEMILLQSTQSLNSEAVARVIRAISEAKCDKNNTLLIYLYKAIGWNSFENRGYLENAINMLKDKPGCHDIIPSNEQLLLKAYVAILSNDLTTASSLFSEYSDMNQPVLPLQLLIEGLLTFNLGSRDIKKTLSLLIRFMQSIESTPKNTIKYKLTYIHAMSTLGVYYEEKKATDKAIKCYEKCLEMDPSSIPTSKSLIPLYIATGYNQRAIQLCESVLSLNPHAVSLLLYIAQHHIIRGDYLSCAQCLMPAFSLEGELPLYLYVYMAFSYYKLGKLETCKNTIMMYLQKRMTCDNEHMTKLEEKWSFDSNHVISEKGEIDLVMILGQVYLTQRLYKSAILLFKYIGTQSSGLESYIYSDYFLFSSYYICMSTLYLSISLYKEGRLGIASILLEDIEGNIKTLCNSLIHSRSALKLLQYIYIYKLLCAQTTELFNSISISLRRFSQKYIYIYPQEQDSWESYVISYLYINWKRHHSAANDTNTPLFSRQENSEELHRALTFVYAAIALSPDVSSRQLLFLALLDPRPVVKHHVLSLLLKLDNQSEIAYLGLAQLYLSSNNMEAFNSIYKLCLSLCVDTPLVRTLGTYTKLTTNCPNPNVILAMKNFPAVNYMYNAFYNLRASPSASLASISRYISFYPSLYPQLLQAYLYLRNKQYKECIDLCTSLQSNPNNTSQTKNTLLLLSTLSHIHTDNSRGDLADSICTSDPVYFFSSEEIMAAKMAAKGYVCCKKGDREGLQRLFETLSSDCNGCYSQSLYNTYICYFLSLCSLPPSICTAKINDTTNMLLNIYQLFGPDSRGNASILDITTPYDINIYKYISKYKPMKDMISILQKSLFLTPESFPISFYLYSYYIYTYLYTSSSSFSYSQINRFIDQLILQGWRQFQRYPILTCSSTFSKQLSDAYYYKSLLAYKSETKPTIKEKTCIAKALFLSPWEDRYWVQLATQEYSSYICGEGDDHMTVSKSIGSYFKSRDSIPTHQEDQIYILLLNTLLSLPESPMNSFSILKTVKQSYPLCLSMYRSQYIFLTSLITSVIPAGMDASRQVLIKEISTSSKQEISLYFVYLWIYLSQIYANANAYTEAIKCIRKIISMLLATNHVEYSDTWFKPYVTCQLILLNYLQLNNELDEYESLKSQLLKQYNIIL
ncbi:hypothetical protein WA158_003772 [Blastocystis sp. Blastoise]